jgi:hypothetical protein
VYVRTQIQALEEKLKAAQDTIGFLEKKMARMKKDTTQSVAVGSVGGLGNQLPPFKDDDSKRDGYSPFVGLMGCGKPLARVYSSRDGGCYNVLCKALEGYLCGAGGRNKAGGRRNVVYKVVAIGGCSSDMLNHLWAISGYISKSFRSGNLPAGSMRVLNLTSSGGRGYVGVHSTQTRKGVRNGLGIPLQEKLWGHLPSTSDFAAAWRSVDGQDGRDSAFLAAFKVALHQEPKPGCLLMEMAANNMPGGKCLLGSTILAIQEECRRLNVAIVVDDVMLAVRCGKRATHMHVDGFQPDGFVIGTKTFGLTALLWRKDGRRSGNPITSAVFAAPNFTGQETTLQTASDTLRRIEYLENNMVCERLVAVGADGVRQKLGLGGVGAYWLRQGRSQPCSSSSEERSRSDPLEPYYAWSRSVAGANTKNDTTSFRVLPPLDHSSFSDFAASSDKKRANA